LTGHSTPQDQASLKSATLIVVGLMPLSLIEPATVTPSACVTVISTLLLRFRMSARRSQPCLVWEAVGDHDSR
jgi:hypothetical protein